LALHALLFKSSPCLPCVVYAMLRLLNLRQAGGDALGANDNRLRQQRTLQPSLVPHCTQHNLPDSAAVNRSSSAATPIVYLQVLVDLVLQQENHLHHLQQVQRMHRAATDQLDLLLQELPGGNDAQPAAAAAASEACAGTSNSGDSAGVAGRNAAAAGGAVAGATTNAHVQQQGQQQQREVVVAPDKDAVLPEPEDMLVDMAAEPHAQQHGTIPVHATAGPHLHQQQLSSMLAAQQQQQQMPLRWLPQHQQQQQLGIQPQQQQQQRPEGMEMYRQAPNSLSISASRSTCSDPSSEAAPSYSHHQATLQAARRTAAAANNNEANHPDGCAAAAAAAGCGHNAAAAAAEEDAEPCPGSQYVHGLMMGASTDQWERALSWGVQDWSDYYSNLVMRLCLLMELLGRLEAGAGSKGRNNATALTAATAAAAFAAAGSGSGGSGHTLGSPYIIEQQQQQQWLDDEELDDAAAMQHEQQQASAEQETLHEIDDAVDDFVTMVNLSVLFNPMSVRKMTCYNLVTGERADCVPAAHWLQVGQQRWQAGKC
jgi:hypothetical protein